MQRIIWLTAIVFASVLACSCFAGDGSLSVDEAEEIFAAARACTPQDECIVVPTYCCGRAINAGDRAAVEDANARVENGEEQCLADCIAIEDLDAECIDGLCTIVVP